MNATTLKPAQKTAFRVELEGVFSVQRVRFEPSSFALSYSVQPGAGQQAEAEAEPDEGDSR